MWMPAVVTKLSLVFTRSVDTERSDVVVYSALFALEVAAIPIRIR